MSTRPSKRRPSSVAPATIRSGRWYGASSMPVPRRRRSVTDSAAEAAVSSAGQYPS